MTGQLVHVGVYSPQEIVREGIVSLLDKHPDKVRIVPTPVEPGDPDPEVVLYDVLALLGGDTATLTYLVEMSGSKVLAVGRDLRPDLVGRALAAGVDGFFSMGADEKELLAAVESAAREWQADEDADADPGAAAVGSRTPDTRAPHLGADVGLTPREAEVLGLIAQGLSNQQIAAQLFLSVNSIKTYIRSAYRKLGLVSRATAVSWAIRHGFAAPD